jgi:DNA modification methylase
MSVRVLTGDCRDIMAAMPADSVDCVVCSPPYWGLRDYGVPGQLGLEPTLGEHIATMVDDVFEHVRRVLKPTGTLWLNYGDSYAASINGRAAAETKALGNDDRTFRDKPFGTIGGVLKPKDLCMVPNRIAIALQEAGWWVRSEIIWHKPNPMPESVRDRPTSAHEKIWLLAKSERYYYDAEAIAEEAIGVDGGAPLKAQDKDRGPFANGNSGLANGWLSSATRNKRNVWTIPSHPFADAHFATFPPALVEPCVLAGCPEKVCAKCGKPWVRQLERTTIRDLADAIGKRDERPSARAYAAVANSTQRIDERSGLGICFNGPTTAQVRTIGFAPSCQCNANIIPGTVLDPFGGSGTTGLVADRLGRNAILIELNQKYAAMAQNRITDDAPLFAEVELSA